MIALAVKWNEAEFAATLRRFADAAGRDAGDVVRDQARLFAQDVLRLTPPFKSWGVKESLAEQRKVGLRRVEIDVRGAFSAADKHSLATAQEPDLREWFERALRAKDYFGLEQLTRRTRTTLISTSEILKAPTEAKHNEQRGSRGRVRRSAFKNPHWVVKDAAIAKFVRKKQKLVGRAKGGWAVGAVSLGVSVPAWIKRHGQGRFIDASKALTEPFVEFTNSVSYIGTLNKEGRIVREGLNRRRTAMERQIRAKLEGRWKGGKPARAAA